MCLICRSGGESENPLFFGRSPKVYWDDIVDWGEKNLKGRSMKAVVCKLAFGVSVYHIWHQKEFSYLLWYSIRTEETIVCDIKWVVQARVEAKWCYYNSILLRAICCIWVFPHCYY